MELNSRLDPDYLKIDKIIEEIIRSEDRIQELNLNLAKRSETNETVLKDLFNDINQNSKRVNLLRQFIKNEKIQLDKEIKKREDEKSQIDKIIKELEEEIFKFEIFNRKLFSNDENYSTGTKLEKIFISEFTNELKENKQELQKLNEKKIRISKNKEEYLISISELNETIQMLGEERDVTENELVNFISHKESLEEMMSSNNFSLFKNVPLNSSLETFNTSVNLIKAIEIHPQEINEIHNLNKFSRNLYDNLIEFIFNDLRLKKDSIFSDKLPNEISKNFEFSFNFNLLEKSQFESLIKKNITAYKESKGLYNVDDYFILLTKKIYDYMIQSVQSADKNCLFLVKEINVERLRFYLKYFFKINYYENRIGNKINFLNKDYKNLMREKIKKIEELEKRISALNFSLDKIESRESQLKHKIDSYSHKDNNEFNQEAILKLNTLRQLDQKMNSLIELKNELNCDIFSLTTEHNKNVRDYEEKIKELEKINEEINKKQNEIINEKNLLKILTNDEILAIRNFISNKYKEIKDYIRKENDNGNNEIIEKTKSYLIEKGELIKLSSDILRMKEFFSYKNMTRPEDNFNITNTNFNKSDTSNSRNQTFISSKLHSQTQSLPNNSKKGLNHHNRLDFIRTLDHSKLNDRTPSHSPIKALMTCRTNKKDPELTKADNSFKNRNTNNIKTDYSIISLEDSQTNEVKNYTSTKYKLNQFNERELDLTSDRSKEHKSRSIDSRHKFITQKMKEDQKIKIHIEALKSEINRNNFGMIGDIEKNKKLNPLAEGSFCLKKTHDFSQSQRNIENDNSNYNDNYDNYLYKQGFKRYKIYLDKLKNKILLTLDKSQPFKTQINTQFDPNEYFSNTNFSYKSQSNTEEIALTDIEKTIVSKNMKKVIEVQQAIKKMQRNLKNELNYESEPQKLTNNDESRCVEKKNAQELKSKYFNLIIQLVNGCKIEIILFSYEEYKAWLNGLAYVIKNYPKKFS